MNRATDHEVEDLDQVQDSDVVGMDHPEAAGMVDGEVMVVEEEVTEIMAEGEAMEDVRHHQVDIDHDHDHQSEDDLVQTLEAMLGVGDRDRTPARAIRVGAEAGVTRGAEVEVQRSGGKREVSRGALAEVGQGRGIEVRHPKNDQSPEVGVGVGAEVSVGVEVQSGGEGAIRGVSVGVRVGDAVYPEARLLRSRHGGVKGSI